VGEPNKSSVDLLGVKPLAEAANTLPKAAVDGATAFLSRICLPAADELGLLLRDKVSAWRADNAARIAQKAEQKYNELPNAERRHAHPRLIAQIIEQGSWIEAEDVQALWAGLLASSCTEDGKDDSNLMSIDFLGRLTLSEAGILDHICGSSTKVVTRAGWIAAELFYMTLLELQEITHLSDFYRIDRELDHLCTLGLITPRHGGFSPHSTNANVTPTALALQMYVRCQGFTGDPLSFFGLTVLSRNEGASA
jgi:hypothetical protein